MTFKGRLQLERPECVGDEFVGGCKNCPKDYGYSDEEVSNCHHVNCEVCWNREISEKEEDRMGLKAGDKMTVRSWESMEEEFGLDFYGGIKCVCGFIDEMRKYCKSLVTIKRRTPSGLYTIEEDGGRFFWSTDMFEPVRQMLSADEVWKWLGEHYYDMSFNSVFGTDDRFGELIDKFTYTEIIEKVSAYVQEQERTKFYNSDIVCVKTCSGTIFTSGKKYEVRNGFFVDDSGNKCGQCFDNNKPFESLEDINKEYSSTFIKLVEE